MKILQVPHTFLPSIGGIEFYVYRLARDLNRNDYLSKIITSGVKEKKTKLENIDVIYCRSKNLLPRNPWLFNLEKHICREKPDIVHIHSIWFLASYQVSLLKRKYGFKIVNTIHGVAPDQASLVVKVFFKIFHPFAQYIINNSDKIIVLSEIERKKLVDNFRISSDVITVIGNGTDKVDPSEAAISKVKKKAGEKFILFTGRIIPDKNPNLLIESFNQMAGKIPEVNLVFVGPVEEDYKKTLLLVVASSLAKRVIFYGSLHPVSEAEEMAALYKAALINVAIGSWEGLPTRVLEAMVQSTPSLVYVSGGSRDVVKNGVNGFLIERLDAELVKEKLELFFKLSKDELVRIERKVFSSVKPYLWNRKFEEITNLYRSIS